MNLIEIFGNDLPGYRTEKDDNTPLRLSDLRKTRLTLKQINRLRIMKDVRKLEHERDLEKIQNQYKAPAAAAPAF